MGEVLGILATVTFQFPLHVATIAMEGDRLGLAMATSYSPPRQAERRPFTDVATGRFRILCTLQAIFVVATRAFGRMGPFYPAASAARSRSR